MSETQDEIDALKADIKQRTFAIQSLMGQRERLKEFIAGAAKMSCSQDALTDVLLASPDYKSQFMQEMFALVTADGKRGGYFVEFGACDGVHLSNTFLLEKKFDWKGILAEPARPWHDALTRNRSTHIDFRCVYSKSGLTIEFNETDEPDQSSVDAPNKKGRNKYSVETISLVDLLTEHQAPAFIDFLSIDTEGTEPDVLREFDFDKYKFGFISVEQHRDGGELTQILETAGYERLYPRTPNAPIWSTVSGFDTWYAPKR